MGIPPSSTRKLHSFVSAAIQFFVEGGSYYAVKPHD
jgi:hypothetical protein